MKDLEARITLLEEKVRLLEIDVEKRWNYLFNDVNNLWRDVRCNWRVRVENLEEKVFPKLHATFVQIDKLIFDSFRKR